jgi:hypothetical protein
MRDEFLEILVEERSMEQFLRGLLPRILPDGFILDQNCFIRPHNGKSELKKKLPPTVRAYRNYHRPVRLLVIQDQDSNDCKRLKQELLTLVRENNDDLRCVIRIACRELENWYLGDLEAIEAVYPRSKASSLSEKTRYREPDVLNGSEEMRRLSPLFAKTDCARRIAVLMHPDRNRSHSFNQLVSGVKKLLTEEPT